MKTLTKSILITWELGTGLGHIAPLRPAIGCLLRRGHRIVLALRDLSASSVLDGLDVEVLQAPVRLTRVADEIEFPESYPHILHNVGFGNASELQGMLEGWRTIFRRVAPDLVVFEHSPTALLASQEFDMRRVLIGNGFACPPNVYPQPHLRPWREIDLEHLQADEDTITSNINAALTGMGKSQLQHLGQLFGNVDACVLTTFAELDHIAKRPENTYWGTWRPLNQPAPNWPNAPGKRIFAYLTGSPILSEILELLTELKQPTLVYLRCAPQDLIDRFRSDSMTFSGQFVDIEQVASSCDVAILHGNHGTTTQLLLGGVPVLLLPLALEHAILAQRVRDLEAGRSAPADDIVSIALKLAQLLEDEAATDAAQAFASRHSDYDQSASIDSFADQVDALLEESV